jgi:catechol 2,3-dioxygenase-like lactoylglutathione lyase family enzyme
MAETHREALPQRLSLVTLGVESVPRAREFYERLGFRAADFESDGVAFFDMNGITLGLFGRVPLAEDANVPHEGWGFRALSCAINLESEADVDHALAFAERCGARITKPAQRVFWGGYSGYFADPDGHLWEIAFNPVWPLDANGRLQLPPPKPRA